VRAAQRKCPFAPDPSRNPPTPGSLGDVHHVGGGGRGAAGGRVGGFGDGLRGAALGPAGGLRVLLGPPHPRPRGVGRRPPVSAAGECANESA
jgi:hypothetical protein